MNISFVSVSAEEKLKILSVTGMIPKYLEQIQPHRDAEQNIHAMCFEKLGFLYNKSAVQMYGGYLSKPTKHSKGLQIDLLIQTKSSLYICEIRFRKKIGINVVNELRDKIGILQNISVTKGLSFRPVLIYVGELSNLLEADDYLLKCDIR